MDSTYLSHFYQQSKENILLEFGNLATQQQNLLDLSYGDPDLITDAKIIEAAFKDVRNGHTRYTAANGSDEFIQSVIDFYKRHYGLAFKKNQVRATVGALHGIYLALRVIVNEGDEVIIHEPFFSPYKTQIKEVGGTPVIIPTYEKDNFQIDIHLLKQAITPKTKAIIINSPNNPTGAVFSKETLQEIANLAIQHHFFILSDEVYEAFSFDDSFTPIATYAPENTITLNSLSKTFAMTGWRIGYMIAPEYINEAATILNENLTFSAPTPSQRAAIYALDHQEEISPDIVNIFKERLTYIEKRVTSIPFMSLSPVKGSMYAFINISKSGLTSIDFAMKLLTEQQVLVIPGKAFGNSGDNYIRLAATQELAILKEAFDKIEKLSF
ncbi:pyridoxal phosphate-dependent aminotransferase [Vagococcus carniphilus]|uniref:pyridoxal phosphate-dependent aminotransferase n=1 Tax=Vagococcus carniphilus TaxID=218144 RepID=UPI00288E49CE|nr:pyridoxal phosphate-dependent aminotransferase [Vagococcus carniphilus]MDT2849250.1 pyridoxal phosphate-dependent aminotransferase [Vagococcus carniphilus]